MNRELSQKRFASGVTALTLSVVIVKVIGLLYKIPLFHLLGAEGMGYFGAAYELYAFFFVISSAGLPVAVSMLVSEKLARGDEPGISRVHGISLLLFLSLGIVGSLAMGFGAGGFSRLLDSERAAPAILAVSPSLLFVCISGGMRGYFQGLGNMRPTAVSQVIEALLKLGFGLGFALLARKLDMGAESAAAAAAFGITVGSLCSMIYLLFCDAGRKSIHLLKGNREENRFIFGKLLALAVPVTLTASISGLSKVLDMGLVLRHLQSDILDGAAVAAIYGCYSTMALPIYNLPASFVSGIALSLAPMLAGAIGTGDGRRTHELCGTALRFCLFLALPSSVGMALFASPILSLLFAGQTESVAVAAPLLSALAFSVVSSCLLLITASILQAQGKTIIPIVSMLAGIFVKFISAYLLMPLANVGIYAIPISSLLCNTLAVCLNLCAIERGGISLGLLRCALPSAISSLLSVGCGAWLYRGLLSFCDNRIAILLGLASCVLLYVIIGGLVGAYGAEEVKMFPMGEGLCRMLMRLHIIKNKDEKREVSQNERGYHKGTCSEEGI